MYRLEYLELAKHDMEDIIYYVRNQLKNKSAALNLANKFIEEINKILDFPYGNAEYIPIKPLKNKYRKIKVNNFLVFYTVDESKKIITIVRVLYRKRDVDKILK